MLPSTEYHSPRIVFAGTPEFAAVHLEGLLSSGYLPCAVYTQPDRPAGRGRRLQASPVKQLAQGHNLPVFQPHTLNTPETVRQIAGFHPDIMIVVAYGVILKQAVLDIPRLGCINVHASLLPRWRGAAPIQRAIAAGDRETGVTIIKMTEALDAGDILASSSWPITEFSTSATLHDELARLGSSLLPPTIDKLVRGTITAHPQPKQGVTYAHKLNKQEAHIDWSLPAVHLHRLVRAFNPWPVATTILRGKPFRILEAIPLKTADAVNGLHTTDTPGTLVAITNDGLDIATGDGFLRLQQVQLAGRKPLFARELVNGLSLKIGEQLG
ncbi:MAG: methionyl-tRNA formyltransferase [Gammaproteobacteria bacterium]|nr:MAG: methionyl-tRNA formyltransferase [Gammaproteobacteria bacterium]